MTEKHEHRYARLSDEAVFCRGCGDIKHTDPPICTLPHYQPVWVIPPTAPTFYPIVEPWRPTYPWWTVMSNGTIPLADGSSITYTVEAMAAES